MPFPEIYVLRHGETDWNRSGRLQGRYDSALTAKGRGQAREMARRLQGAGVSPATHRVLSSPQGRAVATARLIFGQAIPISTDPRLAEIGFGEWTGRRIVDIATEIGGDPARPFPDLYAAAPGAETFPALWARCSELLHTLDGPAVLVSHGITGRFLRAVATGLDPDAVTEMTGGHGVIWRVRAGRAEAVET